METYKAKNSQGNLEKQKKKASILALLDFKDQNNVIAIEIQEYQYMYKQKPREKKWVQKHNHMYLILLCMTKVTLQYNGKKWQLYRW